MLGGRPQPPEDDLGGRSVGVPPVPGPKPAVLPGAHPVTLAGPVTQWACRAYHSLNAFNLRLGDISQLVFLIRTLPVTKRE